MDFKVHKEVSTVYQKKTKPTFEADIESAVQNKSGNNKKLIADMHTQSVNSHDSVCEIEDM